MVCNSSKLKNGLHVLTHTMPYVNSVSINIIVKVGSRYETISESGISHFLEHMAFKGTKTRSAIEIAKEFDAIGGYFNAYTSKESTVYYTKVLKDNAHQALDILADILQNSLYNDQDIEKELSVISQEIAGVNDCPDDLVFEKFYESAYKNQPLGRSILGTYNNISKFDKSSFVSYVDKHYRGENIFISVAGNIEHTESVLMVEQLFSNIAIGSSQYKEQAIYSGGLSLTEKKLEQSTVALGFESVSYQDLNDFYRAQVLSIIFGGSLSSRLFYRIREELGLAYSVGSSACAYSDSGIFSIYAAMDHKNIQVVIEKIVEEMNKLRDSIAQEELDRAKAQISANIYMAEEKPEYKSEEIGRNFALFGKFFLPEEVIEMISKIETKDLEDIACRIFSAKPTLSIVGSDLQKFDFNKLYGRIC